MGNDFISALLRIRSKALNREDLGIGSSTPTMKIKTAT